MASSQPSPQPEAPNPTPRRRLTTLLKIGITVAGLYLVLRNFDAGAVWAAIVDVELGWMAAGALLIALSLVVRAYRWHLILHGVGSSMRFGRLVELYLVGSFFNAFLPSGLGGDVVRAAEATQDVESSIAVSTVLIDRLTGLMALFAMALAVLPFRPANFPDSLAVVIALVCVAGLVGGLILLDGRLFLFISHRLPGGLRDAGGGFVQRLSAAVHSCGWDALTKALLVSVVFNLMQVGWWDVTGRALGLGLPYSYYLLVVPIMSLALLVPSIGGLGVRENLAPALFAGAGIRPEDAVALTLLVFALERVASLLGAPVYIVSALRGRESRPVADAASRRK